MPFLVLEIYHLYQKCIKWEIKTFFLKKIKTKVSCDNLSHLPWFPIGRLQLPGGPHLSFSLPSPPLLPLRLLAASAAPPLPPSPARAPPDSPLRPPLDSPTRALAFTSARDAETRRSGEPMAAATAHAPAADKRYQLLRLLPSYPQSASLLPCRLNRRSPITRV